MATVVDILETRLDLTNLAQYTHGLGRAGGSIAKWSAVTAGAAAIGLKAGQIIGGAFREAAGDAAKFTTAAGNFKGSFPVAEVEEFSGKLSRLTAVADDTVAGMLGLLGTYQLTGVQARALAMPLLNSQRALEAGGKSAEGLAEAVGKAFQGGNLGALRKQGVFVDEAAFKTDRLTALMAALQAQGGDAALKFGKTAEGGMVLFDLALKDLQGALGKEFIPALTKAVHAGTDFIHMLTDNQGAVKATAIVLGTVLVGAFAATIYSGVILIGFFKALKKSTDAATASALALGVALKASTGGGVGKVAAAGAGASAAGIGAAAGTAAAGATAAAASKVASKGAAGAGAAAAGVGALGKAGQVAGVAVRALTKFAGPAGLGLMAGEIINMIPTGENEVGKATQTQTSRAAVGAGVGAGVGAFFGGVGAVPGALIGAAVAVGGGMVADALATKPAPAPTAATDPVVTELQKQTALLDKMATGGKAVDFNGLSVVQQRGIMNAARAVA